MGWELFFHLATILNVSLIQMSSQSETFALPFHDENPMVIGVSKIMPANQPLCHMMGLNSSKFSKEEIKLLEIALFAHICRQLKEIFREQYSGYFRLLNFTVEMEDTMLDDNLICFITKDILSTEEYTLDGIVRYTYTHEDVIHEVITGRNTNPSVRLFLSVLELHRSVRRDLYRAIINKMTVEYLAII